jgi:hypothetical protein
MSMQATAPQSGDERRAWVRYPCNVASLYQPGTGQLDHRWWFAQVRDISKKGIGLILPRRFEPGTQLAVALYSRIPAFSRTLEATVVHVAPLGENWAVGCAFAQGLSDDELHAYWSD